MHPCRQRPPANHSLPTLTGLTWNFQILWRLYGYKFHIGVVLELGFGRPSYQENQRPGHLGDLFRIAVHRWWAQSLRYASITSHARLEHHVRALPKTSAEGVQFPQEWDRLWQSVLRRFAWEQRVPAGTSAERPRITLRCQRSQPSRTASLCAHVVNAVASASI